MRLPALEFLHEGVWSELPGRPPPGAHVDVPVTEDTIAFFRNLFDGHVLEAYGRDTAAPHTIQAYPIRWAGGALPRPAGGR